MNPASTVQRQKVRTSFARGIASHSLVEHSLCPLDLNVSKQPGTVHETQYCFTDKHRNRRKAKVEISLANGLNPRDEMYLHGLLSLTFSQPEPSIDFYATPFWCLKTLGVISKTNQQGHRFTQFREAIKRLAGVTYSNNNFYDPIRGEHREVAFGLLKYSLPKIGSNRSWHFVWDPQFFRYCETVKGSFQFDFNLYRKLDPASRRLFLLLNKVFHRKERSPRFDARSLAVETLGFSNSLENYDIKRKLTQVSTKLLNAELIQLPTSVTSTSDLVRKESNGKYSIRFQRGPKFGFKGSQSSSIVESPLYQPLAVIGFDNASIRHILASYSRSLVQEWADITQAAIERKMIRKSPEAYFTHYIREAKAKRTTPPDWWRELRKKEFIVQQEGKTTNIEQKLDAFLRNDGKQFYDSTFSKIFTDLKAAGQDDFNAKRNAEDRAKLIAKQKFNRSQRKSSCGTLISLHDLVSNINQAS